MATPESAADEVVPMEVEEPQKEVDAIPESGEVVPEDLTLQSPPEAQDPSERNPTEDTSMVDTEPMMPSEDQEVQSEGAPLRNVADVLGKERPASPVQEDKGNLTSS